jgi:hypothetical protein
MIIQPIELAAAVTLALDFFLRLIAAPASVLYRDHRNPRLSYICSFHGVVDLFAWLPHSINFFLGLHMVHLDLASTSLRLLRNTLRALAVVRLLKLDRQQKVGSALPLLQDAVNANASALYVAAGVLTVMWVCFAALLFIFERHDGSVDKGEKQSWRYASVPHALTYTLIHLTGDFPLIKYTLGARVTCFFILVAAVEVMSVPAGLLCGTLTELLESQHEAQRMIDLRSQKVLCARVTGTTSTALTFKTWTAALKMPLVRTIFPLPLVLQLSKQESAPAWIILTPMFWVQDRVVIFPYLLVLKTFDLLH